jgi:S-methylmethionine-dependent homocysteine/selenocysteine methylase
MITLLDGPLGTELAARGVSTPLPLWSAAAIDAAPEIIAEIHRDYAKAGATVHTANTFRTKRRTAGEDWLRLTNEAVRIARQNVPQQHRIAGSISPLEDCYHPERSPGRLSRPEHREMAEALAAADCDLLLCETFPNLEEAVVAVEEAVRTGVATWLALTAGPDSNLLTPAQMVLGARQAVSLGASAVMVNCTPATDTLRFIEALQAARLGVPIGAYANAGSVDEQVGWQSSGAIASKAKGAALYCELAKQWIASGATLIGGCCGTTPAHIAALHATFCSPRTGTTEQRADE